MKRKPFMLMFALFGLVFGASRVVPATDSFAANNVKKAATVEKTDTLTASTLIGTETNYTPFSDVTTTSGIKYAGRVGASDSAIQTSSTNPNGIVSTSNGGTIKSVSITFNTSTSTERVFDVYAKNTAYSGSANLYNSSTKGTKVASFTYSTTQDASDTVATASSPTVTYTFTDSYSFIGLRSNSGSILIDSISITWTQNVENQISCLSTRSNLGFDYTYTTNTYSTDFSTWAENQSSSNGSDVRSIMNLDTTIFSSVTINKADASSYGRFTYNADGNYVSLFKSTTGSGSYLLFNATQWVESITITYKSNNYNEAKIGSDYSTGDSITGEVDSEDTSKYTYEINSRSFYISNASTSNQLYIYSISASIKETVSFSNIRAKFGAFIPDDLYNELSDITEIGCTVTIPTSDTPLVLSHNNDNSDIESYIYTKTIDEVDYHYFTCIVTNINASAYSTVMTATPYITATMDGSAKTAYLRSASYSISTLVDAYQGTYASSCTEKQLWLLDEIESKIGS